MADTGRVKVNERFVPCAGVSVATFSDVPQAQSRACELIRAGVMRARSSLACERGEARAGEAFVVVDGAGVLRCICRVTSVAVKAFRDVDASDAWLEAIGDRSLEDWRAERAATFARRARTFSEVFTGATEIVLERFEVVWQAPF